MTENPATVRLDAKVRDAVQVLHTLDVRHLPIVRADGTLAGILSDRDLRALSVPYIVLDEYVGNLQTALDASVATLMNADVLSVEPEADASEIVDLMLENKIGAVPVVEADGTLVGIVSYVDVLRELPLDDAN
jgi:CBS domain-containing protein